MHLTFKLSYKYVLLSPAANLMLLDKGRHFLKGAACSCIVLKYREIFGADTMKKIVNFSNELRKLCYKVNSMYI